MFSRQKKNSVNLLILAGLFIVGVSFLIVGCASTPKAPATLDPAVKKPQLIVNPDTISLGVDKLMNKTTIVFEGSGFKPKDSVFISLIADGIDVPVASGVVGSNGTFKASVDTLAKITGLLRATPRSTYAKDGKQLVTMVLTQPTIPPGEYTARATSMISDKTADTKVVLRKPSFGESIVDGLGGALGKIEDKRPAN